MYHPIVVHGTPATEQLPSLSHQDMPRDPYDSARRAYLSDVADSKARWMTVRGFTLSSPYGARADLVARRYLNAADEAELAEEAITTRRRIQLNLGSYLEEQRTRRGKKLVP